MKKMCSFVLAFVLVLSLVGCNTNRTPENVVTTFMTALQQWDWEKMNTCVEMGNSESFDNPFTDASDAERTLLNYIKNGNAKMTFSIASTEVTRTNNQENRAVVIVNARYLDFMPILKNAFVDAMAKAFSNVVSGNTLSEDEMMTLLIQMIDTSIQTIPESYKDAQLKFECTKINNEWKITSIPSNFETVATCNILNGMTELLSDFLQ